MERSHEDFLKQQWGERFDVLEKMVDEFRTDSYYEDNHAAMRAISVALTQLQTAHMWVNKAIYSKENK